MHVCGLVIVDPATMPGGYSYAAMRAGIDERVRDVAQFTRKLKKVPLRLDHPVWVRDEHFDIHRHVHRLALPQPGGYDELTELLGHLAGQLLDRSRPLWEMWVIEGYEGDKVAVLTKMHHATVDGVSGANLLSHLTSLEPDSEPLGLGGKGTIGRAPGDLELFGRGMLTQITRPLSVPRLIAPSTQLIAGSLSRARKGTAMAAPFSAPRTSFNGTITGRRVIGFGPMSLKDIKDIKKTTGATVNDVVMTVTGGALRSYLADRGELPDNPLLATVPVSVRNESHREVGQNKVSALFAHLGTDIEDPLERLGVLGEANQRAKEHQKAVSADALQDWAEFSSPSTFGLAVRAYAGLRLAEKHPVVHNLVVSNVPGPPVPIYFVGARVLGLWAFGPVFHGAGLNITVLSNHGEMQVGIIASRESVADVDDLVRRFPIELAALSDAVRPSGPRR